MGSVEGGVNLRSPGNCNSFLKGNGGEQFGGRWEIVKEKKTESETKEGQLVLFHCVDGQNPAPPGMYITH